MLQKAIRITGFDVFPNGSVRPSALQKYMQQLAREDCDQIGCTYSAMRQLNMVFVVTKMGIRMSKAVFAGDTLTVRTFNNRIEGITYYREYEFFRDGAEVIHATTQWVLVNYDTRSLLRPRSLPFPVPEYRLDNLSINIPRKLLDENGEFDCAFERIVRLSDLDENNHLNNCVYSDIALDALPFDGLADRVSEVQIIFRHEARQGDRLQVSENGEAGRFLILAHNETSDLPCFEALCVIDKI